MLVVGQKLDVVGLAVACNMFWIYVSNRLARRLIDFYFARTASALNKGTQEGGVGHG